VNKVTILTTSQAGLADPLLQTAAAVLGPARVLSPLDADLWQAPLDQLLVYSLGAADARTMIDLLRQHPTARVGWIAVLQTGGTSEDERVSFPAGDLYLVLQNGLDEKEKKQEVIEFVLRMRAAWQEVPPSGQLARDEVKHQLEDFLAHHNTCTLATVYEGQVSSRAIEYRYAEGRLYLVSEGGEKFAGLLSNGRAAVSIYDVYQGFERLAGMQLSGWAEVPAPGSADYLLTVERFGLKPERLKLLPAHLNAIVIHLEKAIYLWSGFVRMGRDARQEFLFQA
jgi:hypothetical protein